MNVFEQKLRAIKRITNSLIALLMAFGCLSSASASGVSYRFSHLLGPSGSRGLLDGKGSEARFVSPGYLAKDSHGNIFVSDMVNIRKVTPEGVVTTLAITLAPGEPALEFIGGIVFDATDTLYLCDQGNYLIRKLSPEGILTTVAGTSGATGNTDGLGSLARFKFPAGLAVNSLGDFFICDGGNHAIRKMTAAGLVTTFAGHSNPDTGSGFADGQGTQARFNDPTAIAIDAAGNLYVTETGNPLIRKITPDAVVTTLAGSLENFGYKDGTGSEAWFGGYRDSPWGPTPKIPVGASGICVGIDGNLFISDSMNHVLRRLSAGNIVSTVAGVAGWPGYTDLPARLSDPTGILEDGEGNLIFTDIKSCTLRKLSKEGALSTLAGSPQPLPFDKDGELKLASMTPSLGMALRGDGALFFTEFGSNLVREITPEGIVVTLAGEIGATDYSDGTGPQAHFSAPAGIVINSQGTLFVADSAHSTIRRIFPDGSVDSFAGQANTAGFMDGQGHSSIFNNPRFLALGLDDSILVSDTGNRVVRIISKSGLALTLAGQPGVAGSQDGRGAAALFENLGPIATTGDGMVYVCDWQETGPRIRKISPGGDVETLPIKNLPFGWVSSLAVDAEGNLYADAASSGLIRIRPNGEWEPLTAECEDIVFRNRDGDGKTATFGSATAIVCGPTGTLYIADGPTIRIGTPLHLAEFTQQPEAQTLQAGSNFNLAGAVAGDGPLTYQWLKNSVAIPGATQPDYTISSVTESDQGDYALSVSGPHGTTTSRRARLVVALPEPGKISNMSIRCNAGRPDSTLIVGFVSSSGALPVLTRAAGPALAAFDIGNAMPDPQLTVFNGQSDIGSNDDWSASANASTLSTLFGSLGAFPFSTGSLDAADSRIIDGTRTVQITPAKGTGAGVALVEAYDINPRSGPAKLINVSARYYAGNGVDTLIAGFVVNGNSPKNLLIRGVGPGLEQFSVSGVLKDPSLSLHTSINGVDTVIAENDDWYDEPDIAAVSASVGAFPLPSGSRDAALSIRLPNGQYTVHVNGVGGQTGEALIEVYEAP